MLEDELQWKTLDPCMLPTPLCGVGGGSGVKLFSCQTQLLLCYVRLSSVVVELGL